MRRGDDKHGTCWTQRNPATVCVRARAAVTLFTRVHVQVGQPRARPPTLPPWPGGRSARAPPPCVRPMPLTPAEAQAAVRTEGPELVDSGPGLLSAPRPAGLCAVGPVWARTVMTTRWLPPFDVQGGPCPLAATFTLIADPLRACHGTRGDSGRTKRYCTVQGWPIGPWVFEAAGNPTPT